MRQQAERAPIQEKPTGSNGQKTHPLRMDTALVFSAKGKHAVSYPRKCGRKWKRKAGAKIVAEMQQIKADMKKRQINKKTDKPNCAEFEKLDDQRAMRFQIGANFFHIVIRVPRQGYSDNACASSRADHASRYQAPNRR